MGWLRTVRDSKVYFPILGSFGIGMGKALRVCYMDPGVDVEIVYHIARKNLKPGTRFWPNVHQHEFRASPGQSMDFHQIYSGVREENVVQGLSVHSDRIQSSATFFEDPFSFRLSLHPMAFALLIPTLLLRGHENM